MTATTPAGASTTPSEFAEDFIQHLHFDQGFGLERATKQDLYAALAMTVRDHMIARWLETLDTRTLAPESDKVVVYLSAEYLLGRQLGNALLSLGLTDAAREGLASIGLDLDELAEYEIEPGLGNGGLGRLAACFADGLATLGVPAVGYGIRYQYGIFEQTFMEGRQVERPDNWLENGNPWELPHRQVGVEVGFGGHVYDRDGARVWEPSEHVKGVPYNLMVPGYDVNVVNTLRLWSAKAPKDFDLQVFNAGDYLEAVRRQSLAENISRVLYPEDSTPAGKDLRLKQQYFFTACSLADIMRLRSPQLPLTDIHQKVVIQLNDTHPVVAIPEFLRLLIDDHGMEWESAWATTQKTFNYTCHTLLPEALERWPVSMFERLLPRHLEIIYMINAQMLAEIRAAYPGDEHRISRMSIIDEMGDRTIRMAHLAAYGSTKINGVAALHSKLLKETVLKDFADVWPERFTNVTNGVTPRRFMALANPSLTELITSKIGPGWLKDTTKLKELEAFADDPEFQEAWRASKKANKERLAATLLARDGITIPTEPMLDIMIKRLHEYKRQMLKLLHVATMYRRMRLDPTYNPPARVILFGAKAAPGYAAAKLIIRLANAMSAKLAADPAVADRLQIVFPANYNVTLAEKIIPAADVSEQISTAGKEASGTGNMKLMLNGAITVGTLDGANVEIRELVGEENFFLFGLTEEEVVATRAAGYDPGAVARADDELAAVLAEIAEGFYSPDDDKGLFRPIIDSLLGWDEYLVLADYRPYIDAQAKVDELWADKAAWTRMSILNTARGGFFSSDRSIQDYLDRIWHAKGISS